MGRITGFLAVGCLLFLCGAVGLVGSWGFVASVLSLTVGGLGLAIAPEDRDASPAPLLGMVPPAAGRHFGRSA